MTLFKKAVSRLWTCPRDTCTKFIYSKDRPQCPTHGLTMKPAKK